jgi:hypothetical protein
VRRPSSYAQGRGRVGFGKARRADLLGPLLGWSEVTQRLEADSLSAEELTKAQVALVKLRKALVQAEEFLPRYDQRQVDEVRPQPPLLLAVASLTGTCPPFTRLTQQQLKALEALLEQKKASSAPKSRFAFKKAASSSSARSAPPPPPATPVASRPPPTAALDATANVELASLSHAFITLPSDLPSSGFSVSLASLSHCIINLLPAPRLSPEAPRSPPITALHIQDLSSCLLIVPDVEGSVLINGFDNCALDVGCWQLRMHRARQTDVFVSMTGERGTPVIEDCKDVRFGPRMLADALVSQARSRYRGGWC